MHYCEICGRASNKKYKAFGYTLCKKHKRQIVKHGKFLDNNPRTINDLNEYSVQGDLVYFSLYNQNCDKISEFVIDIADIGVVKYKKWRFSHGKVVTGTAEKVREAANVILGEPSTVNVIHKDGNPLNNRRNNLQIVHTENCASAI